MPEFYTRKGDEGLTGVLGKGRYPKYDLRLEALGTVDELNSMLGLARCTSKAPDVAEIILHIQRDLYSLMSEVATTASETGQHAQIITEDHVAWIEKQVEVISSEVKIPGGFIVPGDSMGGAALDMARTVTRRAERRVLELLNREGIKNTPLQQYLNRLSSLFFVMELRENQAGGQEKTTMAKENAGK